jgi:formate/nitrite transporter FocA (FNT family)
MAKHNSGNAPEVEKAAEREAVEEASHLSARLIYEVVRREGEQELDRPTKSLVFSGLAAGLCISFSLIGQAVLRAGLPPDASWVGLASSLGYTLGFLIVILGRMQLFTENTITTVLPFLAHPRPYQLWRVSRLWGIVLTANIVGATVAAASIVFLPVLGEATIEAVREISEHATGQGIWQTFIRGIPAGLLVAALVWMLGSGEFDNFFIIVVVTWLISAAGFTHIIAGSVEMVFLVLTRELGLGTGLATFFLPALAGNIVGGTAVFTLLAWGQVQDEVPDA